MKALQTDWNALKIVKYFVKSPPSTFMRCLQLIYMFELLIEHRAWMLKSLGTLQTRSLPLHYRGDQLLGADWWGRKGRSSRSLKKRSRSLKTRSRSLKKKSRSLKTKSRSLKKRSRKSIVKMTTPSSLCWKNFGACDAETQNTAHSPPPSLGEPFFCDFSHS